MKDQSSLETNQDQEMSFGIQILKQIYKVLRIVTNMSLSALTPS